MLSDRVRLGADPVLSWCLLAALQMLPEALAPAHVSNALEQVARRPPPRNSKASHGVLLSVIELLAHFGVVSVR